jgi:hypothetical protein
VSSQPPSGWPPHGWSPGPPQWQPPAPKPKAPLVLGILIGAATPIAGLLIPVLFSSLTDSGVSGVISTAPFALGMLVVVTGAGLLFSDQTRRWGAGILIGFFGMLIIGAGACVVLLVVVLSSYSGG